MNFMLKIINERKIFLGIFFFFLIIYISPLLSHISIFDTDNNFFTFYYGANFDGGTRNIQYLPILNEIISEKNIFQNSVDMSLPNINFENIRFVPFLIASLPSLLFKDISTIILSIYIIGYILNVFIFFLIINKFILNKNLAIYLSVSLFLVSGFIVANPLITFFNFFLIDTRIFLDYGYISDEFSLIFQTLSNFILILFFYFFILFCESRTIKVYFLLIISFILLGFSYQTHFIVGFFVLILDFFLNFLKKKKQSLFFLIVPSVIFFTISIFQVYLIKQGSWSSADYSEISNHKILINELFSSLKNANIKNIFTFFFNSFFLIPIILTIIFRKNKILQENFVPVFITSILFSFCYFNLDFMNHLTIRVLIRGIDVIIGIGVFISIGLFYLSLKNKYLKIFVLLILVYIPIIPSIKILNMAKHNFSNDNIYFHNERLDIYNYLKNNTPNNSVVVSNDPYDWELIPVFTNNDMYFSNIFNSYRSPEEELSKYFNLLKFLEIEFEIFMNDFVNIIDLRNQFKEKKINIENKKNASNIIINNVNDYKTFLISRHLLGFTYNKELIFRKFNNNEIKYNQDNFKKILFPQMKKIYNLSDSKKINKVDYLILDKFDPIREKLDYNFEEVYKNKKKVIYKIK